LPFLLRTCYGEVANLLYGETGVMDFGLYRRIIILSGDMDVKCTVTMTDNKSIA